MARKWRQARAALDIEAVDMIEHNINRYKAPVVVPYVHIPQSFQRSALTQSAINQKYYTKKEFNDYILELNLKGYVVGRPIITKYGILGRIGRFVTCPEIGMAFYTDDKPNVMYIIRQENEYTSIAYNEDEVKLVETQEGNTP